MTRLEANLKILELLTIFLESNPDQRFTQALANLRINKEKMDDKLCISGLEDLYNEESQITLGRMEEQLIHISKLDQ